MKPYASSLAFLVPFAGLLAASCTTTDPAGGSNVEVDKAAVHTLLGQLDTAGTPQILSAYPPAFAISDRAYGTRQT